MSNQIFKVFSSCFLVKGVNRSLIIDSQRWKYFTIPNAMYDLLKTYDGASIEEVGERVATTGASKEVLSDYFNFLFENEIIFQCSSTIGNCFPPMQMTYDHPSVITNAIIACNNSMDGLNEILSQLTALGCYNLEIRLNKPVDDTLIVRIFDLCKYFEIENLSLFLQINTETDTLNQYLSSYSFVNLMINFNQDVDQIFSSNLIFTTKDLSNVAHCGLVAERFFTPTLQHYRESIHHNTCLNRKVAIDENGNIRNCPGMKETFGNIKDSALAELIETTDLKKYWNITKDQVSKCKDCEFRHICTDCRAYLDEPDDIYAAPLKCGYDPYTCEWEEWSTNPLKQLAIMHYQIPVK